ncbi:MAG: hypothetical protein WBX03_19200 [Terriglobales bacterium]|jgi:hypothetical protein
MRNARRLLAMAWLAGCAAAQSHGGPAKIGASAVWQVSPQFLAAAHAACDKSSHPGDVECLITQMAKAGAPIAAVNFTRELYKQSHGEFGIMTGFQNQNPVAFAWITYPLRANTNYGLLLVNGRPPIVNVEDLKLLDRKAMEQSFQFQDLKNQFPKVDLWPGDRDGKEWPNSQAGPSGGTQFVVSYPLLNGCHACEHAGFAIFTWNFDAQGKFLGTAFMGMTPPPLN